MNNRFKFRVWDVKLNQYVPTRECDRDFGLDFTGELRCLIAAREDHQFIFQQYTGLNDINGKEVYEGDILAKRNVDYSDTFYKVEYSTNELAYVCRTVDDYFAYLSDFKFKVVGNIYEPICNPDHNGECLVCDEFPSECPIYKFKNCKECGVNNYE
jgi:hypothetical protein